jgi:hypothetical protein
MSEVSNKRPVSGLAITSLVLGILTLLMFWIPILPLAPGLLAVILGAVALWSVRRGTASGGGLAVAGLLCAVLGMVPTALLALAFVGIGVAGPDAVLEEAGNVIAPEAQGPAGVTLRIKRNEFFKDKEYYEVEQRGANIGLWSSSYSGFEPLEFQFNSEPADRVRYKGTLHVTAPKQLEMTLDLENTLPFRLTIEGLREVTVWNGCLGSA